MKTKKNRVVGHKSSKNVGLWDKKSRLALPTTLLFCKAAPDASHNPAFLARQGLARPTTLLFWAGAARRGLTCAAMLLAALLLTACGASPAGVSSAAGDDINIAYPIVRDVFLLDTFCELTIYEGGGEEAMDDAVHELNRLDALFNKSREESDIYRINHREGDRVEISPETADMLAFARDFSIESGGVLEPAIEPLTAMWDIVERTSAPSEAEVREALSEVVPLAWDIVDGDFVAYDERVRIDIGSFAKGFIADRLKSCMLDDAVRSAIINLGGNILCLGQRVSGEPFRIAVREPGKSVSEYSHIVEVDDLSVVTAGIYERYFEEGGVVYHHILDASTGYPVTNELESVTVVGPESAVCDAVCTTVFILGEEEGERFLDEYNASHGTGYYALWLLREDVG